MPSITWGNQHEPYPSDDTSLSGSTRNSGAARWERMVNSRDPQARLAVDRAVKKWNTAIRDYLRAETGFVLTRGRKRMVVNVEVSDGMPILLLNALEVFKDPWARLLLHRKLFLDTTEGIYTATRLLEEITQALRGALPQASEMEAFACVGDMMQRLNHALDGKGLPEVILGLEKDGLGAYFCGGRRVKIYWLPISMLAFSEGWQIEDLTFIVLAHELAHAYTHAGIDIDGNVWSDEDFANSELELVEGLAQYYAEVICKRCSGQLPKVSDVFNAMLEKQSSVYKAYRNWNESDSGEAMRALLRSASGRSHPRPLSLLDEGG